VNNNNGGNGFSCNSAWGRLLFIVHALAWKFHTVPASVVPISLTPRFSGVIAAGWRTELFQQFSKMKETVETV
jgi:hypothetical protein